jgi:hypothetical protein
VEWKTRESKYINGIFMSGLTTAQYRFQGLRLDPTWAMKVIHDGSKRLIMPTIQWLIPNWYLIDGAIGS